LYRQRVSENDKVKSAVVQSTPLDCGAAGRRSVLMLIRELWQFMKIRKKYWIMPIIIMLLGLGFLIVFSQAAVLPFVYTLF